MLARTHLFTTSRRAPVNAAARWVRCHLSIGLPSAVLAAIAGAAAFKDEPDLARAPALASTALTTLVTFLKPSERAELHKAAAGHYQALRNDTRLYREVELLDSEAPEDAKARLLDLAKSRDKLSQSSPAIPRRDYELAKQDIDSGRACYRADKKQ